MRHSGDLPPSKQNCIEQRAKWVTLRVPAILKPVLQGLIEAYIGQPLRDIERDLVIALQRKRKHAAERMRRYRERKQIKEQNRNATHI